MREADLSVGSAGQEAAHDWVRAAHEVRRSLEPWWGEAKQERPAPDEAELEGLAAEIRADEPERRALDLGPVPLAEVAGALLAELDDRRIEGRTLLRLDGSRIGLPVG